MTGISTDILAIKNKVNNGEHVSALEWTRLLLHKPKYIGKCDKASAFGAEYWVKLICKHPNMIMQCPTDIQFTAEHWKTILKDQPQLKKMCPNDIVKQLDN